MEKPKYKIKGVAQKAGWEEFADAFDTSDLRDDFQDFIDLANLSLGSGKILNLIKKEIGYFFKGVAYTGLMSTIYLPIAILSAIDAAKKADVWHDAEWVEDATNEQPLLENSVFNKKSQFIFTAPKELEKVK